MFQLTAARRRLGLLPPPAAPPYSFNSQPPEGGWDERALANWRIEVSTHSRPKAAGRSRKFPIVYKNSFNSQPPEGGWLFRVNGMPQGKGFNSQPPEGGWANEIGKGIKGYRFQLTAARRRLDKHNAEDVDSDMVSTHSRPKAAGISTMQRTWIATWFQLTAARRRLEMVFAQIVRHPGFNSQPPEGGWRHEVVNNRVRNLFQLTAARRRLDRWCE